jgi:hypothetical protein
VTWSLAWRWIVEFVRRPVNVALLITVPIVLVSLTGGVLSDFSEILGGPAAIGNIEVATAGWAAAALAGISGFFHVASSRHADRRLARAHGAARAVVSSRLASVGLLAVVAAVASLIALRVRTDAAVDPTVIGATILAAVIYVAIGVIVGAIVRSDINGSLIVMFIWFFDVFLGPGMGGTGWVTRLFPLHFPTLVAVGVESGHAGHLGQLGASVVVAVAAVVVASAVLAHTTSPTAPTLPMTQRRRRLAIGLGLALVQLGRMRVLWLLIIGLPVVFITTSVAITPSTPTPVRLEDNGSTIRIISMADVHGAVMVPITIGFIASLVGLFVILDTAEGDRRLTLTHFRTTEILTIRLVAIGAASLVATAASIGVTAASFDAARWPTFVFANVLVAWTYAMIGVIVAPLFGRLGGLYVLLLLPFIDVGIAQNAMFDAAPPAWGKFLPAHGAVRVMMDAAFTPSFDVLGGLLLAVAWIVALTGVALGVFRRSLRA